MYLCDPNGQLTLIDITSEVHVKKRFKARPVKSDAELISVPYFHLDLSHDYVDLFGSNYWEMRSPHVVGRRPRNTGVAPRKIIRVCLSCVLEPAPHKRYYLSKTACLGILRRAYERGKELPYKLKRALMIQAGLIAPDGRPTTLETYHISLRDEGIDLNGVSGALMATTNMQMQTFVTQADEEASIAFAANQRDEVRDLHDVAGALASQPGMKQQTFIAAGFSAGQGSKAGGIGYQEELAPTLKGAESGTNMVPSVLCLNDQGGSVMDCTENLSGTLRAQEHGHQPLVYENHGIDSRYTGPHNVVPTMSARYGTGGNNVPLVEQEPIICITGNAIDRQPQNGGNGIGYQEDIAYTLTATDHHAVFSRQRVDLFKDNDVVSTQSARQHKDATDLVYQAEVFGQSQFGNYSPGCTTLRAQGGDNGGGSENLVAQENMPSAYLIRRLTPLECERLQGFPDGWTYVDGASDSARYKALGNSVAIPCVDFTIGKVARVSLAS